MICKKMLISKYFEIFSCNIICNLNLIRTHQTSSPKSIYFSYLVYKLKITGFYLLKTFGKEIK